MQKENDIQLAQANTDPGFKVPGSQDQNAKPSSEPALSSVPPGAAPNSAPIEVAPVQGAPATDTSARDLAIGGAVFLVLLIVFFFARNAYANHLVRRRVAPSSADTAGWLMFFGLSFLSAAAVLAILNAGKFLTVAITGTLLVFGIAALVGAMLTGRR
jgi:tellurite resistance protein TehA-like permease